MAEVFKCDVCGQPAINYVNVNGWYNGKYCCLFTLYLCEDCYKNRDALLEDCYNIEKDPLFSFRENFKDYNEEVEKDE